MLEKEFDYFIEHQDELVEQYDGRHLVIVGEEVVGDFDTALAALFFARKRYDPGTFMIQLCEPGREAYTVTVTSTRVECCV